MTMTFFLVQGWLWEVLWSSSPSNHWAGCRMKSTFRHMSQSDWEMICHCCVDQEKMTLQNKDFFFICSQLMRHPLIKAFHLSNLLQMHNDYRKVNVEFFGNFLCSCKRISFDGCSQLVIVIPMASHCAPHLQGSGLLCKTSWTTTALYVDYQFLGQVHSLLISWVVSTALWPILNSNKKITWICFLSNIISLV